jgi:hypothetical protein
MDEYFVDDELRSLSDDPYSSNPEMETFVGKMKLLDGRGHPGLMEQVPLWNENAKRLTPEQFARCTVALGLPDSRPSGFLMANIARRFARGHEVLSTEFSDFALLTVLTVFDDDMFERVLRAGLDMTPLFANEILNAIAAVPMHRRVKSRSEE